VSGMLVRQRGVTRRMGLLAGSERVCSLWEGRRRVRSAHLGKLSVVYAVDGAGSHRENCLRV